MKQADTQAAGANRMASRATLIASVASLLVASVSLAAEPTGDPSVVKEMPGLVAFWTFSEPAGEERRSYVGPEEFPLVEVGGKIDRVEGGPYSGYSASLDGKHHLKIPYVATGRLNISGPDAEVTMFAVARIVDLRRSRTIAGMWCEGMGAHDDSGTRQYGLLMNMPAYGGGNKLVPHISSEGGVTRRADGSPFPWCCDYAVTKHDVPTEEWCTLAFSYDSKYVRAYINGKLDKRELDPAKDRRTDPYFTEQGPAFHGDPGPDGGPGAKDRGMNPYYHGRGIFAYDPAKHANTKIMGGSDFMVGARFAIGHTREQTVGLFGGLAVFDRALSNDEIQQLHDSARVDLLNQR
ncbi:hypothetical protein [Rubinisphaera sp. JC750]|uniref:hypothetical protein n=1 Tax=Rubinisphaera sp. JC750 TaxID=2898658 RepID=UPI001F22C90F|nr:hypothetical protein [Rubinisphaera sp. JC750]